MAWGSRGYARSSELDRRERLGLTGHANGVNLLGGSRRARRQTLTPRGRATLIALVALLGVAIGIGWPAGSSDETTEPQLASAPARKAEPQARPSLEPDATSNAAAIPKPKATPPAAPNADEEAGSTLASASPEPAAPRDGEAGFGWFARAVGDAKSADAAAAAEAPPAAPAVILERLPVSDAVLGMDVTNRAGDASDAPRGGLLRVSMPDSSPPDAATRAIDPATRGRFFEVVDGTAGYDGPLRVEYAFDAELSRRVFRVLDKSRVKRGHVVVLDVETGRVLAYASADPQALPPQHAYPAASLAKVVTGAASLETNRRRARQPCLYRGSPYRLTKSRVNPTRGGNPASLEKAMAGSYNQCFAQLAVHALGAEKTIAAFERFGWNRSPAPGHEAGTIEPGEGVYGLGKLGSGLAPSRITALHAAQLAASLDTGELVDPWWIDRVVDAQGRSLELPARGARTRVMNPSTADELRSMLVRTTKRGTARRAFRSRRGYRLGEIEVAGKTGNLSGREPRARYEWFAGAAPANDPKIAVAVVQAHGHLWWRSSAQIAADVFVELFCEKRSCSADRVGRYTGDLGAVAAPMFLNETADIR